MDDTTQPIRALGLQAFASPAARPMPWPGAPRAGELPALRTVRAAASPASVAVQPLARALALLEAFVGPSTWLSCRELSARAGLPASTAARMAQTLHALGYLQHDDGQRRYRLAAPVLALGYGAADGTEPRRRACVAIEALAGRLQLDIALVTRQRLALKVVAHRGAPNAPRPAAWALRLGGRIGIGESPLGWALLAALPELERYYLMEHLERSDPRRWPRLRRRIGEAVAQVYDGGSYRSVDEWAPDVGVLAVPVRAEGQSPSVLAAIGAAAHFGRGRVQQALAPGLLATAALLQRPEADT